MLLGDKFAYKSHPLRGGCLSRLFIIALSWFTLFCDFELSLNLEKY